jgi:hypothetical protein
MKNILLTWLNPEAEVESTDEVEETVEATPATSYSTPAPKKKASNFDENEFDALFTEAKPTSNKFDEDDDLPF